MCRERCGGHGVLPARTQPRMRHAGAGACHAPERRVRQAQITYRGLLRGTVELGPSHLHKAAASGGAVAVDS